VLDGV
jgi:hypothetical protein